MADRRLISENARHRSRRLEEENITTDLPHLRRMFFHGALFLFDLMHLLLFAWPTLLQFHFGSTSEPSSGQLEAIAHLEMYIRLFICFNLLFSSLLFLHPFFSSTKITEASLLYLSLQWFQENSFRKKNCWRENVSPMLPVQFFTML